MRKDCVAVCRRAIRTDEKNALDIEKYVKNLCRVKVRDNDIVYEVEDVGVLEA